MIDENVQKLQSLGCHHLILLRCLRCLMDVAKFTKVCTISVPHNLIGCMQLEMDQQRGVTLSITKNGTLIQAIRFRDYNEAWDAFSRV